MERYLWSMLTAIMMWGKGLMGFSFFFTFRLLLSTSFLIMIWFHWLIFIFLWYNSFSWLIFIIQFAHRKCVQRWCNEKGDITCEICHQVNLFLRIWNYCYFISSSMRKKSVAFCICIWPTSISHIPENKQVPCFRG